MRALRFAKALTEGMATWRFVITFLILCVIEIAGNKFGWFKFDPTMLVLNTILSLLAAIQGSVIMIYQKYQDEKRDEIISSIARMEDKHGSDLKLIKEKLGVTE